MDWPKTLVLSVAIVAAAAALVFAGTGTWDGAVFADWWPVLVTVIGTGGVLAGLILNATSGIRADLRAAITEAAADRRAMQSAMDTWVQTMRTETNAWQAEMQRLAERQSRAEGSIITRTGAD